MGKVSRTRVGPRTSKGAHDQLGALVFGHRSLRRFLKKHGMTAVLVYGAISLGCFAAIYSALLWGLDATPLLERFGMSSVAADGTVFLVALACTKLLVPIKVPLAVFIVVQISRQRERRKSDETELSSLLEDEDPPSDAILDRDPISPQSRL